jgi:hypothetical protein
VARSVRRAGRWHALTTGPAAHMITAIVTRAAVQPVDRKLTAHREAQLIQPATRQAQRQTAAA